MDIKMSNIHYQCILFDVQRRWDLVHKLDCIYTHLDFCRRESCYLALDMNRLYDKILRIWPL